MFADNTDFQCPVAKFSKVEHILQTSHTWLLGELSKNNVKQSFPTAMSINKQGGWNFWKKLVQKT